MVIMTKFLYRVLALQNFISLYIIDGVNKYLKPGPYNTVGTVITKAKPVLRTFMGIMFNVDVWMVVLFSRKEILPS